MAESDDRSMEDALKYQHDLGFDEGYDIGWESGYQSGYDDGVDSVEHVERFSLVDVSERALRMAAMAVAILSIAVGFLTILRLLWES